MKIYLCGAINRCDDSECKDWREYTKTKLHGTVIDPMIRDYRGNENLSRNDIVDSDKADIDECEILLVYYKSPSVGTSMEMLYAFERNKIVILVTNNISKLSPWLLYHSHKCFSTLEDAINYINSVYNKNDDTEEN